MPMKLFFLALSLLLISCAYQIPPSGGPPDTTPPEIIKTYPKNGTVNFKDNQIEVEFSEYVDKRSVQDATYITPYIEGEIQYKWSGRKLRIIFPEKLKDSTTYVVTFGTEIRDLNAGNKMRESFTLAFSTGASIDSGSIEGKIFTSKENFMVFAYLIDKINPDTLSPLHTKPNYVTQAGKDGSFKFQFIKFGKYRLFAINDKLRNLLYNPGMDEYGVFWEDVTIDSTHPSASNIAFKITLEDTSKPFVSSINIVDDSHITLKFSEKIILKDESIKLKDGERELAFLTQLYPDSSTILLITQEKFNPNKKYILTLSNITDLAGNELDEVSFELKDKFSPDTTAPSLVSSIPSNNESDVDLNREIKLIFDDILAEGFKARLSDSTGKEIEIKIKQNLNQIFIKPTTELKPNELFTLKIFQLQDINGNGRKDTLEISFRTVDPAIFGAIEGMISCEDTISRVIVSAFEVSSKKIFQTKTKCNSKFILEQIPQGKYLIEAFIDSNDNGKYDYGKVFPFVPSEKFSFYPDTVKVRPRWTTENVNIKF